MLNECPRFEEFLPERFIDGTNLGEVPSNPRDVVFGFGRRHVPFFLSLTRKWVYFILRRCPGLHVADNSVWTAVAQMLTIFEFLPEIKDGKECIPPQEFGIEMAR